MNVTVRTLVVAPSHQLFMLWLRLNPEIDPHLVEYVARYEQIAGSFTPIISLNGGSHDRHVLALVRHPSRRGIVTNIEV